jgi:hypothetical protein
MKALPAMKPQMPIIGLAATTAGKKPTEPTTYKKEPAFIKAACGGLLAPQYTPAVWQSSSRQVSIRQRDTLTYHAHCNVGTQDGPPKGKELLNIHKEEAT